MYCRLFPDTNILKITKILGLTLSPISFESWIFPFCRLPKSSTKKIHQEHADYAVQGVDNLQMFKEQVIQNYLGTPTEILGLKKLKPPTDLENTLKQRTKTLVLPRFLFDAKKFILWWHLLIYGFKKSFEDMD